MTDQEWMDEKRIEEYLAVPIPIRKPGPLRFTLEDALKAANREAGIICRLPDLNPSRPLE